MAGKHGTHIAPQIGGLVVHSKRGEATARSGVIRGSLQKKGVDVLFVYQHVSHRQRDGLGVTLS